MYIMYADEFGHDGIYDPQDPNNRHHPLFGLAGFAVRSERWRHMDRQYLRLKQRFYATEIIRANVRAERYEPKELNLRNRRDVRFTNQVFDLLEAVNAKLFAFGLRKPVAAPHNSTALYGSVTQGLMRAFERVVRDHGAPKKALLVIDRRQEARDVEVLSSAQSYLFSAAPAVPGGFDRVIESPMLVRSEWHHGIQIADNVCRVIGRAFRFRTNPATEAAWQQFDATFGPRVDALTHRIAPNWASVYVRP